MIKITDTKEFNWECNDKEYIVEVVFEYYKHPGNLNALPEDSYPPEEEFNFELIDASYELGIDISTYVPLDDLEDLRESLESNELRVKKLCLD